MSSQLMNKKVMVIGDDDTALDIACDTATIGLCKPVYVTCKEGGWVIENYILGHPWDLYASRSLLTVPWRLSTLLIHVVLRLLQGNTSKWGLRPRYRFRQGVPRICGTFLHHVQQGDIKVVSQCQKVEGKTLKLESGETVEVDAIVVSQMQNPNVSLLSQELRSHILKEKGSLKLYKKMFPSITGSGMAFIGFVKPVTGGLFSLVELQARWFAELCKGSLSLPNPDEMDKDIEKEEASCRRRFTEQEYPVLHCDSVVYNDDIASCIGVKPKLKNHPMIAWRLLLGSGGPSQYRLKGPHCWSRAEAVVCNVPVPEFVLLFIMAVFVFIIWLLHLMLNEVTDEILDWMFD